VIGRCVMLGAAVIFVGCSTGPVGTSTTVPVGEPVNFDIVPFRWEDYSNRVWISVTGVDVENPSVKTNRLKNFDFSYSPNTGKSPVEAIAILSFNMLSGAKAERLLLKVLFGMKGNWLSNSNVLLDGKAFHIYTFEAKADLSGRPGKTNTIYFDATKYHNLF
jgi:hypothetical protein